MTVSRDQIGKWQQRLFSVFRFQESAIGEMPERVAKLTDAELTHRNQILAQGSGFRALMLSYQEFAMCTLVEAPKHGNVLNAYNYAMNWAALRRLRCSWNTYNDGYYDDAAAQLRSVLETTMYLSCVLRGRFGFQRIHEFAIDPDLKSLTTDQLMKATRVHNRKLSADIRDIVYGKASTLSEAERKDVELLLWTHHSHVHRSESSVLRVVPEMIKSKRLPLVTPKVNLPTASIFCNSAVLGSWTHVRVLPYLSVPSQFSDGWKEQYRVLDEAFRFYIDAWEKPMKKAFVALIEKSYNFEESTALRQVLTTSTD